MTEVKIVYNAEYGGFGLSRAAILCAREISGNPSWGGACLAGDINRGGFELDFDFGSSDPVERHDRVLVQVVEELGDKANGPSACLRIYTAPRGACYKIDEHDGLETVEIRCRCKWAIAD